MIKFTEEEIQEIENMAGIGFSIKQIAVYFEEEPRDFEQEFKRENSLLFKHYKRGLLVAEAVTGMKLLENAKGGNITAVQMVDKRRRAKEVEALKQKIFYE